MVRSCGVIILAVLVFALGACAAAPSPTATPLPFAQAATTPAPTTAAAPATATLAPLPTPTAAPVVTATRAATATSKPAPTTTARQTPTPTRTPTRAAGAGGADVLNKLKGIRKLSADLTVETAGETTEGRIAYLDGKMRMDIEAMGLRMSVYIDPDDGYMYNAEQKSALALPYEQAADQSTDPSEMLNWEKTATAPRSLSASRPSTAKPAASTNLPPPAASQHPGWTTPRASRCRTRPRTTKASW